MTAIPSPSKYSDLLAKYSFFITPHVKNWKLEFRGVWFIKDGYNCGFTVLGPLVTHSIYAKRSESRCLRRFGTFLSQFLNLLIRDLSEIGFIS